MVSLNCGRDQYGVPVISRTRLEQFAEELIEDYRAGLLESPQPTDIEQLVECYLRANLEVRPITMTNAILGVAIFNEGCVPVYDRMKGTFVPLDVLDHTIMIEEGIYNRLEPGRFNFTLAHEASHLICHDGVSVSNGMQCRQGAEGSIIMCRPEGERYPQYGQKTPVDWMEWQADYFGAALLMPRKTVQMAIEQILWNAGYLGGVCGMREINRSPKLFAHVAEQLSKIYRVSKTAAAIRMNNLGYKKPLK